MKLSWSCRPCPKSLHAPRGRLIQTAFAVHTYICEPKMNTVIQVYDSVLRIPAKYCVRRTLCSWCGYPRGESAPTETKPTAGQTSLPLHKSNSLKLLISARVCFECRFVYLFLQLVDSCSHLQHIPSSSELREIRSSRRIDVSGFVQVGSGSDAIPRERVRCYPFTTTVSRIREVCIAFTR
jgi:hypothetical protein